MAAFYVTCNTVYRSNHRRCSVRKGVLGNFAEISKNTFFTEHLWTAASVFEPTELKSAKLAYIVKVQ